MVASHAFVALPRPAVQCSLSSSTSNLHVGLSRAAASSVSLPGKHSLRVRSGPEGDMPTTASKPQPSVTQSPPFGGRPRIDTSPSSLQTVSVEDSRVAVEGVAKVDRSTSDAGPAWGRITFLAGGDIAVLLTFAAIGRLSHGMSVFDWDALRTADPFIAGWFLGAYLLGGYGPDGQGVNGFQSAILAALKSWAVGIPVGLAIRGVTMGHVPPQPFVLVSMASTFVLLLGWRATAQAVFPSKKSNANGAGNRKGSIFELLQLLTSLVRRW